MKKLFYILTFMCSFYMLTLIYYSFKYQLQYKVPEVKSSKMIKVAVIDTGFDFDGKWTKAYQPKICRNLSKDFTNTTINDIYGHGTHIVGLITKYAENSNYCLIIYKYFLSENDGYKNLFNSNKALEFAIQQKVDIINYSGGGNLENTEECLLIHKALDNGIKVITAAGNQGQDLTKFKFYPALCDNRVIIVEAIDNIGKRISFTNYSNTSEIKTIKELGNKQYSILPNSQWGYMEGTSQATAITTGKLIKKIDLQ